MLQRLTELFRGESLVPTSSSSMDDAMRVYGLKDIEYVTTKIRGVVHTVARDRQTKATLAKTVVDTNTAKHYVRANLIGNNNHWRRK